MANKPFRYVWMEEYISAFECLSRCRSSGFGVGPISFTDLVLYAQVYQVEDLDQFIGLIQLMDEAFISHHESVNKESQK